MDDPNQTPETPAYPRSNTPELPQTYSQVPPIEVEPATESNQQVTGGLPVPVATDGGASRVIQAEHPVRKTRRKLPIIALGIAVLIVLLAAGSALAYTWYQNPDRVIMDGLSKALQAKTLSYTGTVTMTSSTESKSSMKLDIKGAAAAGNSDMDVRMAFTQGSKKFEVSGKGVVAKDGTLYIRFNELKKLLEAYLEDSPETLLSEESMPLIDKLMEKVDGQWIKIAPSDLDDYNPEVKSVMTCMQDAAASFRDNEKLRNEFVEVYKKHPFISMEDNLGIKDGNLGYVLATDKSEEKAFWIGTKETALYKQLVECDDSFKINDEDLEPDDEMKSERTEIWLSQWQHEIKRVYAKTESKEGTITEMSWFPSFNQEISVDIPKDAKTLSDLQADIEAIFEEYMTAQIEDEQATQTQLGISL